MPAARIEEVAREIGRAGGAVSTHVWRNAAAGQSLGLGGGARARAPRGPRGGGGHAGRHRAVGLPQGGAGAAHDAAARQGVERAAHAARVPARLLRDELPPARTSSARSGGKLAMYFTRVYNPVWTNPDGMSWIEMLTDEAKVERHACLTPIWSETAHFADYVLPMGHASERHDLMSQETHAARWIGFRQPVLRVALERQGKRFDWTWQAHEAAGLGQVWEEDEFWIELSWRIDPDGSLGIRKYFESPYRPGEKLRIEEFYRWIFESSVPGLPAAAQQGGADARSSTCASTAPSSWRTSVYAGPREGALGRRARGRPGRSRHPGGHQGRRRGGRGDRRPRRRRLSHAVAQARVLLEDPEGLEVARARGADLRAEPRALVRDRPRQGRDAAAADLPAAHTRSTRAPATPSGCTRSRTRTRCGCIPEDAARLGVQTGDLLKIETEIGHFVDRVWVTEAIRPGVIACSHHLGRWRLQESTRRRALVHRAGGPARETPGDAGGCGTSTGCGRSTSADPDSERVWWEDAGVHQNLTFPVHPDPGERPALLASEGARRSAPPPTSATATCSSTPTGPTRCTGAGSP